MATRIMRLSADFFWLRFLRKRQIFKTNSENPFRFIEKSEINPYNNYLYKSA
jgi:hypothetical protein